jgi:hypothetical protein
MAASSKMKVLKNKGKSPLMGLTSSASKAPTTPKSGLDTLGSGKKSHAKADVPEQAFEIPGFGNTGMTGES